MPSASAFMSTCNVIVSFEMNLQIRTHDSCICQCFTTQHGDCYIINSHIALHYYLVGTLKTGENTDKNASSKHRTSMQQVQTILNTNQHDQTALFTLSRDLSESSVSCKKIKTFSKTTTCHTT